MCCGRTPRRIGLGVDLFWWGGAAGLVRCSGKFTEIQKNPVFAQTPKSRKWRNSRTRGSFGSSKGALES